MKSSSVFDLANLLLESCFAFDLNLFIFVEGKLPLHYSIARRCRNRLKGTSFCSYIKRSDNTRFDSFCFKSDDSHEAIQEGNAFAAAYHGWIVLIEISAVGSS